MPANDTAEAAADWLIRLEAQTTPETWDQFQAWLDNDRHNRAAFIRLRTAWTHCDALKDLRPVDGRIDSDLLAVPPAQPAAGDSTERAAPLPSNFTGRRLWLATAAAATIGVIGLLTWPGLERGTWKDYETDVGGSQKVALADGSIVLLNTDSRLRVHLSGARRDIELIRGEALFTVANDKQRPFYVKAAQTLVRVVGTEFSVRINEDRSVEVLVAAGRVAMGVPDSSLKSGPLTLPALTPILSAGDRATLGAGSLTVAHLATASVSRKLAWVGGRVAFDDDSLADALHEFNRYNHRHLVIADPAIANVHVGGIFNVNDPRSFVAALESLGVVQIPASGGDAAVVRLVSDQKWTRPRP